MIKKTIFAICRHKIPLICILCLFPVFLSSQSRSSRTIPNKTTLTNTKTKKETPATSTKKPVAPVSVKPLITPPVLPEVKIKPTLSKSQLYLDNFDSLSFDTLTSPDYQVLIGNVRFHHGGAYLYCDSAHYYKKDNSLFAFGNVHMEQGDTLFLYGARLFYDGNAKLAMVREKVRLENKKVTLFTDSLNFDRVSNIGYFFDGGLLVSEDENVTNELSSEYGQYSPETKIAQFKNDVKLKHPKFVLTNQELIYNTTSGIADIFCPTEIVADSGYIYTESGWYDTKKDKSRLLKRSYILNNHRRLTGDTLNYDKKNGIGEAFGKIVLIDSTQQVTFKGDYAYSEEKTQNALISKNAEMIEHSSKDTLYLHADSLVSRKDSIYKAVTAYHGVRFYRSDVQGVCDSLYYSTRDSVLNLYAEPILWSKQQQLSGNFMQLYTKNGEADYLHIQKSAMVIAYEADSLYNQLSGKDLKAFFREGEVNRIVVNGNAETVYIPRDEKNNLIGLNRLEGSSLTIDFEKKKMKKLVVWPKPLGKFYPLNLVPSTVRYLKNFVWNAEIRPNSPEDIFRDVKAPLSTDQKSEKESRKTVSNLLPVLEPKTVEQVVKTLKPVANKKRVKQK